MSDKLYAIKESTLSAIGDAVRNKTGIQEELREISYEVDAVFNHNLASFNPYKTRVFEIIPAIDMTPDIDIGEYNYTLEAPNATSIKAKVWVYVNQISGAAYSCNLNLGYGDSYNNLVDSMKIQGGTNIVQEYDLPNTNKLNFKVNVEIFNPGSPPMINYTAHIEVYGFDAEGNPVKGEKEIVYANDIVKKTYTPLQMAETIDGLMTIPDEVMNLTGNCRYKFAFGHDWIVNLYGEKITTKDITSINSMFYESKVEIIPFEINGGSSQVEGANCFNGSKVKQLPKMNFPIIGPLTNLFNGAYYLREIPDDKWNVGAYSGHTNTYDSHTGIFGSCYSLRYITSKLMSNIWNKATASYYSCFSSCFSSCYVLDEIVNLPVAPVSYTSNVFSSTFSNCSRLKDFTFETNEDGTPKTANWKNQTIDLSGYIGQVSSTGYVLNYNSGITADKEVKDDATYQALKNDPDWFTTIYFYSRYNHDSAVNTINSLPDCSATGTNTIKFRRRAGELTDGGAINTLTEEEIAVAVSKGWTVSFV